jgi:predicted naringenin-chalcone synthase
MGCYAAFPGLRKAAQAVASSPGRLSLVLALELCSLHFQPQDTSLENVVSSALFADGAAAALLGEAALEESARAPAPRWLDFETHCDYQTLGHMAFHLTDTGFHMHLSAYVPKVLEADVQGLVDHLLHRNGLRREQVRLWGVHPGSSKILDYIQNRLGLADEQMICSRRVLHDCGNMSSPTILFVLDELQRQENPSPGDYGVLLAFGPGLTMESALLQW